MSKKEVEQLFQQVRADAFQRLPFEKQRTANIYLDERIYQPGETLGPAFQKIVTQRPNILVFLDDLPQAAFAHPCRYLLYDAQTGQFEREVAARFPPYLESKPASLKAFHEPMRLIENPNLFRVSPAFRCPILHPVGNRYAVLFSGLSGGQPINDMEFLYRTLIDTYGYDQEHITVLHFDGTLNSFAGMPSAWPGDGTPYRIVVNGPGTRAAFEEAIDDLKGKIEQGDMLLIHTNQCGDIDLSSGLADLLLYPDCAAYTANDFASKVGELPAYSKLIVMMGQCYSGGFISPLLAHSTADATSIACAATATSSATISSDGNWDSFARDWIAAQAGHDPSGAALAFNPDTNGDGTVGAREAFNYALAVRNPVDSLTFFESSAAGGDIALGQEYVIWRWWCDLLYDALESHRVQMSASEYYEHLHAVQPELSKLTAELDRVSDELQKSMTAKIELIITSTFEV